MGWGNLSSNMEMGFCWASGKLRVKVASSSVFLRIALSIPQSKCFYLVGSVNTLSHCRKGDDAGSEGYFKGELLAQMWPRLKKMGRVYTFIKPYPRPHSAFRKCNGRVLKRGEQSSLSLGYPQ